MKMINCKFNIQIKNIRAATKARDIDTATENLAKKENQNANVIKINRYYYNSRCFERRRIATTNTAK